MFNFDELRTLFASLDALRASGEINMFGAHVYLVGSYGIDERIAKKVTGAWMRTFASDVDLDTRVMAALPTFAD